MKRLSVYHQKDCGEYRDNLSTTGETVMSIGIILATRKTVMSKGIV